VLYCVRRSISAPMKRNFCDCCRNTGHFCYGVEKAKHFVNVHFHCIVSNMNSISKIPSLIPRWKNFCGRPCSQFMFSLWNCSSPPFHEHEKYDGYLLCSGCGRTKRGQLEVLCSGVHGYLRTETEEPFQSYRQKSSKYLS